MNKTLRSMMIFAVLTLVPVWVLFHACDFTFNQMVGIMLVVIMANLSGELEIATRFFPEKVSGLMEEMLESIRD